VFQHLIAKASKVSKVRTERDRRAAAGSMVACPGRRRWSDGYLRRALRGRDRGVDHPPLSDLGGLGGLGV